MIKINPFGQHPKIHPNCCIVIYFTKKNHSNLFKMFPKQKEVCLKKFTGNMRSWERPSSADLDPSSKSFPPGKPSTSRCGNFKMMIRMIGARMTIDRRMADSEIEIEPWYGGQASQWRAVEHPKTVRSFNFSFLSLVD